MLRAGLKERQGLAMGIFGAGNSGAAVNKFIAPVLIAAAGWTLVPKVYAGMMLAAALIFWVFPRQIPAIT
jgi:NNP family nitrate/nitrite transporter-like MFS transporter